MHNAIVPATQALTPPRQPPELVKGVCASGEYPSEWWTSDDCNRNPQQRDAAIALCRACPVLEACRTWALLLPTYSDPNIYAGMRPSERAKAKKQAKEAARIAALPPLTRSNALKTHCDSGHKLSGKNLILYTNPRTGRVQRQCRKCRCAANRAWHARLRQRDYRAVNARQRARYAARKAAAASAA